MTRIITTLLLLTAMTQISQTAPPPIAVYDMTSQHERDLNNPAARRAYYDETQLIAALQGLVNRDEARLYTRYNALQDDFWWARMAEEGGWLAGRETETIPDLPALLRQFRDTYRGVVVWDERVPATSNVASSLAGIEDLLPVRYDESPDSLYQRLMRDGNIPVVRVLLAQDGSPLFTGEGTIPGTEVPSTGSAKNDAYVWLVEHYLKTGKANPLKMGYYLDAYWLQAWQAVSPTNHTLNNHDYIVAHRGIIFDLNVWEDEATVDDPDQKPGTDRETLQKLLHAAYERAGGKFIHIAGFVPWAYKYTNHGNAGGNHEPVPSEWHYAEIISCFNGYMDADAIGLSNMANASFFMHVPLEERYPQNALPTEASLKEAGILDANGHIIPRRYWANYVGDYDSAAWLYQRMPDIWKDENRGKIPLTWAFNPNLCERFPLGMAWTRATKTPNDYFCAGDSGAGYINPGNLLEPRPHSGLPSGVEEWERHCTPYYEQWDLSLTGFIIDGYARGMDDSLFDAYARFSGDGIIAQKVPERAVHGDMPILRMDRDLSHDVEAAANLAVERLGGTEPQFRVFRSILQNPSYYVELEKRVNEKVENARMVDLYTLLWLVREAETHPERYYTGK